MCGLPLVCFCVYRELAQAPTASAGQSGVNQRSRDLFSDKLCADSVRDQDGQSRRPRVHVNTHSSNEEPNQEADQFLNQLSNKQFFPL